MGTGCLFQFTYCEFDYSTNRHKINVVLPNPFVHTKQRCVNVVAVDDAVLLKMESFI